MRPPPPPAHPSSDAVGWGGWRRAVARSGRCPCHAVRSEAASGKGGDRACASSSVSRCAWWATVSHGTDTRARTSLRSCVLCMFVSVILLPVPVSPRKLPRRTNSYRHRLAPHDSDIPRQVRVQTACTEHGPPTKHAVQAFVLILLPLSLPNPPPHPNPPTSVHCPPCLDSVT